MSKDLKNLKVAIVSDHIFEFNGAARVTAKIGEMFTNPSYYFLFGDMKLAGKELKTADITFSVLQKVPFLRKIYRYTYFLWPVAIESFNFSKYDLVISSSFSVSHGVVTNIGTKHISYIHSPMRYAWDLSRIYFNKRSFSFLKRLVIPFFVNILRIWDVNASKRSDLMISNSKFVSKRMFKYWKRKADVVIYPPVKLFNGDINQEREEYFVIGNPFEPNKMGEFVFDCAKELGFKLKVIGNGGNSKKMKSKYSRVQNIEFLGRISEEEKFKILSNAKGLIASGIEDFGIFPVEAMSCGTPVLAYKGGGYIESVKENISGIFFEENSLESFKKGLDIFEKTKWNHVSIHESIKGFGEEVFEKEFREYVLKNI